MTTIHLDAGFIDDGYWVKWDQHDAESSEHGRVGNSPLTEHGALELLEAMHNDLAAAGFKLERAPNPAMVVVHASVEDIERVTGQHLRR
jgi:hypothetical protein